MKEISFANLSTLTVMRQFNFGMPKQPTVLSLMISKAILGIIRDREKKKVCDIFYLTGVKLT